LIFPKVKYILKGTHFESVEAVKTKIDRGIKAIARKGFPILIQQIENTDATMY